MADIDISKAILRYGLAAGYTGPRRRIRKKTICQGCGKGEKMIMDGYQNEAYMAKLMRNDVVNDTVTGTAEANSYKVPAMQGWICPVCGRGLSPYTSVCPCKNGKGWEITC